MLKVPLQSCFQGWFYQTLRSLVTHITFSNRALWTQAAERTQEIHGVWYSSKKARCIHVTILAPLLSYKWVCTRTHDETTPIQYIAGRWSYNSRESLVKWCSKVATLPTSLSPDHKYHVKAIGGNRQNRVFQNAFCALYATSEPWCIDGMHGATDRLPGKLAAITCTQPALLGSWPAKRLSGFAVSLAHEICKAYFGCF